MFLKNMLRIPVNYCRVPFTIYPRTILPRFYSHHEQSEGEQRLINLLKDKLNIDAVDVRDISGGCGAMYEVYVSSVDFKGKRVVQQHRLVTQILKDEVENMHGLRIQTEIPEEK